MAAAAKFDFIAQVANAIRQHFSGPAVQERVEALLRELESEVRRHERSFDDIFKVQDEIAGTVSAALKVTLSQDLVARQPRTVDAGAYNQLLQGNYVADHNTRADTEKAIGFYQQALRLDPNYALAWAKLANTSLHQASIGWVSIASGTARAREALQQALVNLIDNAIKHSPKGAAVKVGLDVEADALRLWVEDQGEGIPSGEQERIFERFYRRGSELRRETQGVGIGLSIVKHIVEAHGGRIQVRSDIGHGSRFTIELPVKTVEGLS